MVQLIVGNTGKGKTKHLLDKVNAAVHEAQGNIVYLDKSSKHMYELNNKVRLIDASEYLITNSNEFVGFILGILSQDRDLQQMYVDSFLKVSCIKNGDIESVLAKLEQISEKFCVDFVLCISLNESELPENTKSKIVVSL